MNPLRMLRSTAIGRRMISALGAGYIRLMHATTKWTVVGAEHHDRMTSGEGRWLLAIWHGRFLATPPMKTPKFRCLAVISNNKDGEIIAATALRFGVESLRGSTWDRVKNRDKGGRQAYDGAIEALRDEGVIVALTPDGPRGPRQRCQQGIAVLSVSTGIPVTPFAYSTRWGINLKSWDRMLLPAPFTRGVKIFGEPVAPPAETGLEAVEAHRLAIEAALNEVTRRADEMCGRTPVEPAEPRS